MTEQHTILLADDDPGLRRLIRATLGTTDFRLLDAADGDETLEIARLDSPEIILLDVNMPKLSGIEVCRILKADPATAAIKIIMLTARSAEADKVRAREVGADDYFVKPFSPVELLNKVYSLFE